MFKLFFSFCLCASVIFASSCGKSTSDAVSKIDRVDILFQDLKKNPVYTEYYQVLNSVALQLIENAKKTKVSDSTLLKSKEYTLEQKYDSLHFKGVDKIQANSIKSFNLYALLKAQYPILETLTQDENVKLMKLSKSYFEKLN